MIYHLKSIKIRVMGHFICIEQVAELKLLPLSGIINFCDFSKQKFSTLADFLRPKSKPLPSSISRSNADCLPLPHRTVPDPKGQDLDFINVAHSHLIHTDWSKLNSIASGLNPFRTKHILLKIQRDPILSLEFYDWVELQSPNSHTLESHSFVLHILTKAKRFKIAESLLKKTLFPNTNPSELFDAILYSYRICESSPRVFDSLFKTYAHMKKYRNCTETFCRMRDYGFLPTIESCNAYISSLLELNRTDIAITFYREMGRSRISPNVYTLNMVISAYCKAGRLEKAFDLFKNIENMGCEPTVVTFNTLISGYCIKEIMSMAIKLKTLMSKKGLIPNVVTYNTLIHGYCKVGKMHEAGKLFDEMRVMNVSPNNITYNTLINGYSFQNNSEMGVNLYEDMLRKGIKADILTFNALILGLSKEGKTRKASYLVKELVKEDLIPNESTFSALISGQCHQQNSERAFQLFKQMKKSGCHPNADTFQIIIGTFCKNKDYEGAVQLLIEMMEKSMTPDEGILLGVLEGLCEYWNADEVQQLCAKLDRVHVDLKCLDKAKILLSQFGAGG